MVINQLGLIYALRFVHQILFFSAKMAQICVYHNAPLLFMGIKLEIDPA
jgi:hypothetical protein